MTRIASEIFFQAQMEVERYLIWGTRRTQNLGRQKKPEHH